MTRPRASFGVVLAAALAFLVSSIAATLTWHLVRDGTLEVVDITHYRALGERMTHGRVPYRDAAFEYPPGALLPVLLPALLTASHSGYYVTFTLLMALIGVGAVIVSAGLLARLGIVGSDATVRLIGMGLAPAALGGVMLTRFDLFPVVVLLLALLCLTGTRVRLGWVLLGFAIAIKVYPIVVLPIVGVWRWRRSGHRAAIGGIMTALAIPGLAYVAFAAVSPRGVGDSLWGQISRPLQIESLGAGVLLAVHQVAHTSLAWASGSGSQNLLGSAASVLASLSAVVGASVLVALWVAFARGPATDERLIRYAAASVTAFVAFSKVFSPQYLVWLVFLVPFVGGPAGSRAGVLLALACIATGIWFPGRYWSLVREFDPLGSWLVLVRDLLVVAVLWTLIDDLRARRRGQARSPSPVRPART